MNPSVAETISLLDFLLVLWRGKWIVIGAGIVGVILGFGSSFFVAPTYRAFVVVMPLSQDGSVGGGGGLLGQLGGLASIAGIKVGGGASQEEAIEVLKSRKLIIDYVEERDLLPILFSEDWDSASGSWIDGSSSKPPTVQDGYREFESGIRTTSVDRNTGVVTLSINWTDRAQAALWANELIAKANQELRERAIEEAENSLKYLDNELKKNTTVEIRQAIYRMIEEQIKAITLANVRDEFSFRVIDPAVVPDEGYSDGPKRLLMAVVAGFLLGVLAAVILWFRRDPAQYDSS